MSTRVAPPTFARRERAMARQSKRELLALLRKSPGGFPYTSRLLPTAEALLDPRFAPGVLELIIVSDASVVGATDTRRECFCCSRAWTPHRTLVGVLVIEFLNAEARLVAGVCSNCTGSDQAREFVIAGLERDLGTERGAIRLVHEGSRA